MELAAAALIAVLCGAVLKKGVPELALVLTLGAGAVMLAALSDELWSLWEGLRSLARSAGLETGLLGPVVRAVAIAAVTRVAAEVCRDAGEGGLASLLELGGKVLILLTAIPLMELVLEGIGGIL